MKKTSILRKLFVMIFTFITVAGFAQINSNSGFESWTNGLPDGWKGSKTTIANANVVQVTDAHTGNYACMLKTTTSHKRFTTQPMAMVAGQQYTISYWAKGHARIRTARYDNAFSEYNPYHEVNSQTYIQFVDTVTAAATVSNGEFVISVLDFSSEATGDSIIIDDVEINYYPPVDENTVATPIINVSGTQVGSSYASPATVSISTTTSNASIYYTIDGSTPTTSSTLYSAPFNVTSSCTVKAFATKNGLTDSEIASETISISTLTVIFEEDFEGSGLGQMTQYSVSGDSKVWVQASYSGNHYANLNAHNAGANEDWLMTPQLTPASNDGVTLNFRTAKNYNGDPLQLKYSTNYTGSGDPNLATWTDITDSAAWSTGSFAWVPSGDVVIAGNAPLYIAFVYTSTASQAAAWEVDDIVVTSSSAPQLIPTLAILSPADGSTLSTLDTLNIDLDIDNFVIGTDGLLKVESSLLAAAQMPNPAYFDATTWALFQNVVLSPLPAGTFSATVSLVGLDSLPLATPVTATTTFTVVAPTLATPTITVTGDAAEAANSYYFTANVTIAAEAGASIHYTTDGTTPDENSTTYSAPFDVTTSCTVKAIAVKANYANSDIASAVIVIDTPTVAAPVFSPASGVFTDSVVVSISCTDTAASIRYTTDSSEPTETSTLYEEAITLTATTTIKAKAFKANWNASETIEATYSIVNDAYLTVTPTALTFNATTLTNDITVSAAYINGPIVLTCDNTHFTLSNDTLTNGNNTVTVTFDGTEPATGIITITGDTLSAQVSLTATVTLPTPTFTPASGASDTLIEVAIACANASATIFYTTDGTTPDSNATLYTAPFELNTVGEHTVKAIAILSGWDNSEVATATYNVYQMTVETPVITPASGASDTLIEVAIACATPDAAIYYTTDGTTPDATATLYTAPFELNVPGTYTVNAIAMKTNWINSQIATATYTVTTPTPPAPIYNDTIIYTTGFEASEDFTAPSNQSNFQNDDVVYYGPAAQQWGVYHGIVSTSNVLSGAQDIQMRTYHSSTSPHLGHLGYTFTNFDLNDVTRVTFQAKSTNNFKVAVSYSIDGGSNYIAGDTIALTSTAANYTFVVSETGEYASVRLRFTMANPETLPTSGNSQFIIDSVVVYGIPGIVHEIVEIPVISPNSGFVYDPTQVSITCATNDASIYYTTDGTEPTESSTLYTTPFTVSSTTTVKAKAFKTGFTASNVASATYTFPVEVANIAAFKAANSATNSTVYKITGDVTFVFENGANFYVQDATGGLLIYDNQNNDIITRTYTEGDVISGGVCGTYTLYNGLVELVPTRDLAAASSNTGTVSPVMATIADISTNYDQLESKLVKLTDVTFTQGGTYTTSSATNMSIEQNGETMQVRNVFKTLDMTIPAEQNANVTGFVLRYNTNYQVAPRNNDDIEFNTVVLDTVAAPVITVNPLTNDMVSVEITCATDGATIYYTVDGSTPSDIANLYASSFVHEDVEFTIKAIAMKEDMVNSAIASYHYIPVGIREHEANVTIYPNPTVDQCTIRIENSILDEVTVFDLSGKMVRSMKVNDQEVKIDMSQLSSGTYFIRILSDKNVTTHKIVKQ